MWVEAQIKDFPLVQEPNTHSKGQKVTFTGSSRPILFRPPRSSVQTGLSRTVPRGMRSSRRLPNPDPLRHSTWPLAGRPTGRRFINSRQTEKKLPSVSYKSNHGCAVNTIFFLSLWLVLCFLDNANNNQTTASSSFVLSEMLLSCNRVLYMCLSSDVSS